MKIKTIFKKLMTVSLILTLLIGSIPLYAFVLQPTARSGAGVQTIDGPTRIADLFPDDALADLIATLLSKRNTDDVVTQAELNNIRQLNYNGLSGTPIVSLEGMQHLKNLTSIDLKQHKITDISWLAPLVNVTYIDFSWNQISDVRPLQNLTNLTSLNMPNNRINSIEGLHTLTKLVALRLLGNKIRDVTPIVRLSLLQTLDLSANSISDLTPFANHNLARLRTLSLDFQNVTHPVALPYTFPVSVENSVKATNGALITVTVPGGSGHYRNPPNVIWNIAEPVDTTTVTYRWSVARMPVAGNNVEFSGQYHVNVYKAQAVRFISDGAEYARLSVQADTTIEAPTQPTKDGYTFSGWYTEAEGGSRWNFETDTVPVGGTTLYAQWDIIPTYTVTFLVDDEVHTSRESVADVVLDEPAKPTKRGYSFAGWYTAPNGGDLWDFQTNRMPSYNLILYAHFTIDTYRVTFNNEGTTHAIDAVYDTLLDEPNTPAKVGHTFSGWYTEPNGGSRWDFATDTMPADNLTLYARFTISTYRATFVNEGLEETADVVYNELLTEPNAPTKEGYTFAGWYTAEVDGVLWDFATNPMPAENMTLYARYTINTYQMTFDAEGTKTIVDVLYDALVAEPVAPTKPGFRFIGWYASEEDGALWNFATDRMPARDMRLHARFLRNYIMRGNDITIERSLFFKLLADDELHDALVNLADVKVFHEDDEDTLIYHIGNTTFVVSNMHELLDIADHGTYNVHLTMYVDPTFAEPRALTIELSLNVVPDTASGGNEDGGTGGNTGGGTDNGSNLPSTGEYVVEKILLSLSIIFGSVVLLYVRHRKRETQAR